MIMVWHAAVCERAAAAHKGHDPANDARARRGPGNWGRLPGNPIRYE